MLMNRNEVLGFVLGLLGGGLAGAAAVILLAPQSGHKTQEEIRNKVQEIIAAGKEAAAERRQELELEYQSRIQIPLHPSEPAAS
jgi:gas vesicle protein